uniref:Sodefrin-like factor n=1 Tax=Pyxicephalus adspersus TaxID=30357 RepID=A0AAV2ZKM6_PYXAD|nr:TPA: hypothetical protein GDO54_003294 [Pyxicephalus adspersus]
MEKNQTENGHQCDACFSPEGIKCTENKTQKCTGNEFECLVFSGFANRAGDEIKKFYVLGCINNDGCLYDWDSLPGSEVFNSTFVCK